MLLLLMYGRCRLNGIAWNSTHNAWYARDEASDSATHPTASAFDSPAKPALPRILFLINDFPSRLLLLLSSSSSACVFLFFSSSYPFLLSPFYCSTLFSSSFFSSPLSPSLLFLCSFSYIASHSVPRLLRQLLSLSHNQRLFSFFLGFSLFSDFHCYIFQAPPRS